MQLEKWHKSSYSDGATNCLEVRETERAVYVRDTQHRGLGHLGFPVKEWAALVSGVKAGEV
ncbi:DUF397 domain-containing protein [Nocardiopsis trehalosi]|jgi:hypothetical protein|uniref:DUF397 domain-containing protein n=1 Tax=Nocardiopsis trehalosi TaxID=109329 RepID=UPI00082ABF35|nr:DUF397 domain-containing protein [Nocardiopsis trehalosi]